MCSAFRTWQMSLVLGVAMAMGFAGGGCKKSTAGGDEICGDGEIGSEENCDDANEVAGDGCGAECLVEDGWTCDATPSVCEPICGDGLILGNEACDDGNTIARDGCDVLCQVEVGWTCDATPSVCEPICGDERIVIGEECDGDELDDETCASLGLVSGDLACGSTCVFDVSGCVGEPECGNDAREYPEQCDGTDLDDATCASLGQGTGTLECAADCTFDISDCSGTPPECGNDLVELGEECEGADLTGLTCQDFGYGDPAGLACTEGCELDTSGCTAECGNGFGDPGEACDDGNTDDCDGCRGDCSTTETGCGDGYLCGPEACDDGNTDDCDGCSATCTLEGCGNGVQECAEQCDGTDLTGETCEGLGHDGGPLDCDVNCGFDEGLCIDCVLPEIWCAGGCVDPRGDDDHCGGCGAPCGAGTVCVGGDCETLNQPWVLVGGNPIGGMATLITAHDLVTDGAQPTVAYVADLGAGARDVHVSQFDSAVTWNELMPQPAGSDNLDDAVALAFDGATYYIAYGGGSVGPMGSIHVKVNGGSGWLDMGAPGYPSSCVMHMFIDLALNGAEPHLTTMGAGGCGIGIEYAWYDGSDWQIRPGGPMPGEITMNGSGNPAILYTDQAYVGVPNTDTMSSTSIHSVKFWDTGASTWDDLGSPLDTNLETGWEEHMAMTADPAGDLWVAWVESDGGSPAAKDIYVKHYSQASGTWSQVGAGEINGAGSSTLPSITLIGGVPWVAYVETANTGTSHVVVRRYDSDTDTWQQLGPPLNQNIAAHATYPVIAGLAGLPYVAFREEITGPSDQRLFVKTFP